MGLVVIEKVTEMEDKTRKGRNIRTRKEVLGCFQNVVVENNVKLNLKMVIQKILVLVRSS